MSTSRPPVPLSPESAYALLCEYVDSAIKPAVLHHYLRCESDARLVGGATRYDLLTQQLRSLYADLPVILEGLRMALDSGDHKHPRFNLPLDIPFQGPEA